MFKRLAFALLRLTGLPWLMRELLQRRRVTILLYHDIAPEVAERHLRVLAARYRFIALEDYIAAREAGRCGELPDKSLIVTLDDGHASNYALLPLLQQYGLRPTIFLCSRIVGTRRHFWFRHAIGATSTQHLKRVPDAERLRILADYGFEETRAYEDRQALSREEIAAMRGAVEFQAHTLYHPLLPNCPPQRVREEIAQSRADMEHDYGLDIYAFSYPNGDYTAEVIAMTRAAGYRCALTIEGGLNSARTDAYLLGRICVPDDTTDVNEIIVRASGLWDWIKEKIKRET